MHLNELDFNQLDDALTSARFNEHTPKQIDDALAVLRGLRGSVITDQDMDLAREDWGTTDDIQIEQNGTVSHEALAAIERLEAENARLREAGNKLADAAYHGEECPMNTTGAYCNCGYDAAAEAWCTALEKTS